MRVGFSTERSPLLPFLILLDYNVKARIRHKSINQQILSINQNDTRQENNTLDRNWEPVYKITKSFTYLCCHKHCQTCCFQTLRYLLKSEEKSNRCTFRGPNSWFLQQRQKYPCHLLKNCVSLYLRGGEFHHFLHAMLISTYKNSIKSTLSWSTSLYIQTISYRIAKNVADKAYRTSYFLIK